MTADATAEVPPDQKLLDAVQTTAQELEEAQLRFQRAALEARAAVIAAATADPPHGRRAIAHAAGVSRQRIDHVLAAAARESHQLTDPVKRKRSP